jgi:hypothetical protein
VAESHLNKSNKEPHQNELVQQQQQQEVKDFSQEKEAPVARTLYVDTIMVQKAVGNE